MTATTNGLDLKVPPAALMVMVAAFMWLAASAVPVFDFALPAPLAVPASAFALGVLTCLAGVASFRRAKTTVNPMKPDSMSVLVVSGIYKCSRNPMYLGFLLILLGWALFLSNALAFPLLLAFVEYINRFQIRHEERALISHFGKDYEVYRARVRRWL